MKDKYNLISTKFILGKRVYTFKDKGLLIIYFVYLKVAQSNIISVQEMFIIV